MFPYVVPHDAVVSMSVYADVPLAREAEIHDVAEDVVLLRVTGDAMDDVIGQFVIHPFPFIDDFVGGFWGRKESEVGDDPVLFLYYKSTVLFHVRSDDFL